MNKYYQFTKENDTKAILNIYGDIVSDAYYEGEVSSQSFANDLNSLGDIDEIDVYINSYGGEVAQGISIYNQLKNHKAKIRTICNGFACSIASIIFLGGDERVMNKASLLMIHNPFTVTMGNADELRKVADDLDIMAQMSIDIYCQATGLDETTIKDMMDRETWINSQQAIELGFATNILEEDEEENKVVQSVKQSLIDRLLNPKVETIVETIIEEKIVEVVVEKEVIKEVTVQPKNNRADKFINLFK